MNLAVPAAPTGPRAPHGDRDGAHAHARDAAGGREFAAALSETAGEQGDEAAGEGEATTANKIARMAARLSHRVEGKDGRGAAGGKESAGGGESHFDAVQAELETATRATITPSSEALSAAVDPGGNAGASTAPATDPTIATAMRDPLAAPDLQGVRDLLAALDIDAPAQPGKTASLDDLVARLGRHLPAEARTAIPATADAVVVEEGASNLEFVANLSDEVLASARVVRQETHFQPVGQDVRRLPAMTPIANDDRLMEISLAAAARTGRQATGDRERPDTPMPAARPIEAAATTTVAIGGDQPMPGSVGQQIADGVQRALASSAPTEPAATRQAPAEGSTVSATFAPALRTIKLQLNPVSLGTVTVLLSGRDGELSIRLEAELAETVGKVEQDRNVLTARLAGAGYGVSEVTVGRIGTNAPGADSDQRDSGARAGGQMQDDGGRGRGSEGGASSYSEERASRPAGTRPISPEAAPSSRSGAVEHPLAGIPYAGRLRPV